MVVRGANLRTTFRVLGVERWRAVKTSSAQSESAILGFCKPDGAEVETRSNEEELITLGRIRDPAPGADPPRNHAPHAPPLPPAP